MYNPYQPYMVTQQIIKVNGMEGAKMYQMMPSSSALLLDETAPRLFVKITDGAGYPTISSYKLEQYVEQKEPDYSTLAERISRLEEKINAKPNNTVSKRKQCTERDSEQDAGD